MFRNADIRARVETLNTIVDRCFMSLQLRSLEYTPIGLIGPFARRPAEEGHRREHENAPFLKTPRAVWTVPLWAPRWRLENAMRCCAQVRLEGLYSLAMESGRTS